MGNGLSALESGGKVVRTRVINSGFTRFYVAFEVMYLDESIL